MNQEQSNKLSESRLANRRVRRQQMIHATISSIFEHGFSGTTLETVTKGAKLSHGVVDFHFESKEDPYDQALGFLAQEHDTLWYEAMLDAGSEPVQQLTAIVESAFHSRVCSPEKLAVWYAFWGQAKYRPNYIKIHSSHDELRFVQISRLCSEIAKEGGYEAVDPASVARGLEALIDGLWLSLLMYPKGSNRQKARNDAMAYLAAAFPRHLSPPHLKPEAAGAQSDRTAEHET